MAMQLRITGETLRITGDPVSGVAAIIPPPPPGELLLATETGELILTDAGESIALETRHGD